MWRVRSITRTPSSGFIEIIIKDRQETLPAPSTPVDDLVHERGVPRADVGRVLLHVLGHELARTARVAGDNRLGDGVVNPADRIALPVGEGQPRHALDVDAGQRAGE